MRQKAKHKKKPAWRPPQLTIKQILAWADDFHERTGQWPKAKSGRIPGSFGTTWLAVDAALRTRKRGLTITSSLAKLLQERRGMRNTRNLPQLSHDLILAWADQFHEQTGKWPKAESGVIPGTLGETWMAVDLALRTGRRGLKSKSSLAKLLEAKRGVRNIANLPRLTVATILGWADAHHGRHGDWPTKDSGKIDESPDETWSGIDVALREGLRGLRSGSSLAKLLAKHRGKRNRKALRPLTTVQILEWADAWLKRTGQWPNRKSGPIPKSDGETWMGVDAALHAGSPP